ncbi:MAG TPA: PilX N-terminal domain-containing pilus assembly protein [Thermoanaerobaculia bacterium]|nr:PilX N-terminal domain-containing pilus assembly protein [Thermoanaerobaculia bacterium]
MGRRGSALVTVVLVILILTIVGLGVAYFAQMEEGFSGNARMTRAAFYVAEVGLRKGESVISNVVGASIALSTILTCGTCTSPPINLPGGGYQGIILNATDPEGGVTKEFADVAVPVPAGVGVFDRGTYSLYVRNNPEDPAGATNDSDTVILLVSVGQVRGAGGRVYTKILEEQLLTGSFGAPAFSQYLSNAGGTSSGAKGK